MIIITPNNSQLFEYLKQQSGQHGARQFVIEAVTEEPTDVSVREVSQGASNVN